MIMKYELIEHETFLPVFYLLYNVVGARRVFKSVVTLVFKTL